MTTWTSLTFPTGAVCTEEKMDSLYLRDLYLQERIKDASLGHVHNGTDSPLIASMKDAARGGGVYWYEEKSIGSASDSIFYLTDDRSSTGDTVFDENNPPFFIVMRGDGTDFDLREIGHVTAGTRHYYFQVSWDSTNDYWEVRVWNKDASTSYTFRLIAFGPPAAGV